jgi:radical SAM protein with 4Fe4S-binding SPASM domain
MELIIKPTELCNFACTFCSSPSLSKERTSTLDIQKVFSFLDRFPGTSTIIVNGGDPLMVKPEYYWEILNFIKDKGLETSISFTTNLWDFYLHPEKWVSFFKEEKVGITTSFNYGETRRISKTQNYTEEKFWQVSDKFLELVGYRPDFISVINEENEHTAIDNVFLAKKMNVECKLNYALGSGRQSKPYLLSKIYKIYLEVISNGLTPWEYNSKQLFRWNDSKCTTCPRNRACDESIRCLQPDGDYYSCGAFGDDKEYPIDFDQEINKNLKFHPLANDVDISAMKGECYSCEMFDICNGCKKTVKDHRQFKMVEEHCSLMKTLAPSLLSLKNNYSNTAGESSFEKYQHLN